MEPIVYREIPVCLPEQDDFSVVTVAATFYGDELEDWWIDSIDGRKPTKEEEDFLLNKRNFVSKVCDAI